MQKELYQNNRERRKEIIFRVVIISGTIFVVGIVLYYCSYLDFIFICSEDNNKYYCKVISPYSWKISIPSEIQCLKLNFNDSSKCISYMIEKAECIAVKIDYINDNINKTILKTRCK